MVEVHGDRRPGLGTISVRLYITDQLADDLTDDQLGRLLGATAVEQVRKVQDKP